LPEPLRSYPAEPSREVHPEMNPSRLQPSRRLWTLAGLACIVLGGTGGAAYAYWNTLGSGSAAATTGNVSAVSVAAFTGGDAPNTALIPGGSSDVVVRINNTNAFALTMSAISLNGSVTASGGTGTCTTTGVTITFPGSPSITVPAGSHLIDLPGTAAMSTASQNGCQGATFQIPVSVTLKK